jgi:hypothetical protein
MTSETLAPPEGDAKSGIPAEDVGPRIYGVIDVVKLDRIAGWAIDRTDAAAALEVDILREGRVVRTVRADRQRADLVKGGVGSGAYGFRADIAPPVEAGFEFTLTAVARSADGARAELRRVGAAAVAQEPAARLTERTYECVSRLTATVARIETQTGGGRLAAQAGVERLNEMIERLELVQARVEATLVASEQAQAPDTDGGLARIVYATLAIALGSLATGVWSLLAG